MVRHTSFMFRWAIELFVQVAWICSWCLLCSAAVLVLPVSKVMLWLGKTWRGETRGLRASTVTRRTVVTGILLDWY